MTPGRAWAAAIAAFAILAAWHNPVFYWFYAAVGLLLLCGALLVVAISRGAEIDELKAELERREREDHPRLHAAIEDVLARWRPIAERNRDGGGELPKVVAAAQRAVLAELEDILAAATEAPEDAPPAGLSDRMVEGTRARLRVVEQPTGEHDRLAMSRAEWEAIERETRDYQ